MWGEGQILTPDQQQKLEKDRFSLLMAAAFHDRKEAGAALLGVGATTLWNWMKGTHFPSAKKRAECLERLDLPANTLKLPDDEFDTVLDGAYELASKQLPGEIPKWIFTGGQLQVEEAIAEPKQLMILITRYADNDTELTDVCRMVEKNLMRGVSYLYVVPSTCRNLRALQKLVKGFESHTAGNPDAGTARIMCVPSDPDEEDWLFIDHVLMVLARVPEAEESFSGMGPSEISHCFEQIFRPGEVPEGYRVWIEAPHRKTRLYLDLLGRWEEGATIG